MVAVWVIGAAVLLAAGFVPAFLPQVRRRQQARQVAWSTAQAAIDSAAISRDAARKPVPEAEALFTRAQWLAAHRGGQAAARSAADYAQRADQLWRKATDA
jgi:3-deoxy-D-manno-octulosonate 8-phosphate phosphatase KdsC-like HAD superfamily phosphatase